MELKDVLIEYREQNNISQRELARRCGLSNSIISILEMGENKQTGKKSTPDTATYIKLATGMGMTVQSLFEKIGDSESIHLSANNPNRPIIIPDNEGFVKIVHYMSTADYETVMQIFERTYKRMQEMGVEIK